MRPNEKLVIIRNENDLKQREVAEMLGISKQGYHLKESGKYDFTQTEMVRLTIIFGCTLNDLFEEDAKLESVVG